jgi:hypothetical protein
MAAMSHDEQRIRRIVVVHELSLIVADWGAATL